MNSQTIGLRVASVVFGLMAIAQLVRLSDTPRGARGRSSDAVVAKCAGLHHFERSESLDVETCAHADEMNEIGIPHARAVTLPLAANTRGSNARPSSNQTIPCCTLYKLELPNAHQISLLLRNAAAAYLSARPSLRTLKLGVRS